VRDATARLLAAGQSTTQPHIQPAARLEAELLLCSAAGITRTTLFAWPERRLGADQAAAFEALLQRRIDGEPMAYILGRRDFHDLELRTRPGALIPRPETELLVDWALAALPADAPIHAADLGTGTGAIALAIARARPAWTLLAVERDAAALAIAAENRQRLGLDNVGLVRGDWLGALRARSLDLVISNPPYVCAGDPHLDRGDLRFEPRQALAAGIDGLAAIRPIIRQAAQALKPGGLLLLEHGCQQGAEVRALLRAHGWCAIVTRRDLAGLERVTGARRP
jgi:release factor glutamine methyltransferase